MSFFAGVAVFFLLVFTSLGDSLAASGRRSLAASDPRHRHRVLELLLDSPPRDRRREASVGTWGCEGRGCGFDARREDPRRNSQLSREMNFIGSVIVGAPEDGPLCLVPTAGIGFRSSGRRACTREAKQSLDKEVSDAKLSVERKGHQGWMKKEGLYFIFPGGGTMFPDGAVKYIEKLGQFIPINGGDLRTALDMGCGIITADGTYFVEVDRLLRPGGYLVISGPPVQWPKQDKEWAELQAVARALCYELIVVDSNTVIWKKPSGSACLPNQNEFGIDMCADSDDPSEAWYFKLKKCASKASLEEEIAVGSIAKWPERLLKPSARVSLMRSGVDVFEADTRRWARRVAYYKKSLGLKLGTPRIRNVMDMNAFLGGFAAALSADPVWVMNVVPARKPLTLDVIYDRGLIGAYHDWCEAFSTYPRTYDLIHVARISSLMRDPVSGRARCNLVDLMVEMDRILRPEGTAVIRDAPDIIEKVVRVARAIRWTVKVHESEPESRGGEKIVIATKKFWKLPSNSQ
ncbi:uncharacterized protein A4U43_C04F30960 [Asparagus officinalis]|uniref:Methyltransferase n=1 Tax=Asparagus officinalis TaxID=4686 RepID=A0A5P1F7K9_ASPOF|nr:uncharacterized protein A4U43_C04F30960 [Asparagus officinalis]